jgi:hypothetical protein
MASRKVVTYKDKKGKVSFMRKDSVERIVIALLFASMLMMVSEALEKVLKEKKKPKLWTRFLSCGHSRDTDVSYALHKYGKPKVGNYCYCRTCYRSEKIVEVRLKK